MTPSRERIRRSILRHLSRACGAVALVATVCSAPHALAGDAGAGAEKSATCAACHGPDGNSANGQWPNLAGQAAKYIAKQLADYKSGARENAIMAGMAAVLSDEDMADLGAYYESQAPKPGFASDRGKAALGEKLYRAGNAETGVAACMACHGPTGAGIPDAAWPRLSGQHREYTIAQLQAFRAGHRANDANGMMRGVARWLSDAEIEALAEYIVGLN